MRKEKQDARKKLIEEAAYEVLAERGYRSSSMLMIAKKAKASNETLYRWYGSKQGLFTALVEENSRNVRDNLCSQLEQNADPIETLSRCGPSLLGLITNPRAIALNRAAAAEADNQDRDQSLGDAIAKVSKDTIAPLIRKVFQSAADQGHWPENSVEEASQTYLSLLIGNIELHRVIGTQETLSQEECEKRSALALKHTLSLFSKQA